MISHKDRILVGLSGGKDSFILMWILNERLKRIPIDYKLYSVHIDLGFDGGFSKSLAKYCSQIGFELRVEYTDYGVLAHSSENRENPCFLCSRLRRKRLFEIADQLGCRKLALGHNKDDLIETLFINMFYAGEISTMMPSQSFFKGKFKVIRPLAYVDEKALIRFADDMKWPVRENPCPSADRSKRAEIKSQLQKLYQGNKKVKGNIFRAMRHVKAEYLLK
jgi:tRNA 2-thiocytidine biosynthesis protein TtcA